LKSFSKFDKFLSISHLQKIQNDFDPPKSKRFFLLEPKHFATLGQDGRPRPNEPVLQNRLFFIEFRRLDSLQQGLTMREFHHRISASRYE
jgi:hypothetical protein